jgi:hypothetical protein
MDIQQFHDAIVGAASEVDEILHIDDGWVGMQCCYLSPTKPQSINK